MKRCPFTFIEMTQENKKEFVKFICGHNCHSSIFLQKNLSDVMTSTRRTLDSKVYKCCYAGCLRGNLNAIVGKKREMNITEEGLEIVETEKEPTVDVVDLTEETDLLEITPQVPVLPDDETEIVDRQDTSFTTSPIIPKKTVLDSLEMIDLTDLAEVHEDDEESAEYVRERELIYYCHVHYDVLNSYYLKTQFRSLPKLKNCTTDAERTNVQNLIDLTEMFERVKGTINPKKRKTLETQYGSFTFQSKK
jgi:hypothetical protein